MFEAKVKYMTEAELEKYYPGLARGEIYDYDSYQLALNSSLNVNPVLKGKLVPNPKNRNEIKFERIDM